jgi:AraC family transcriptional activator of pobA
MPGRIQSATPTATPAATRVRPARVSQPPSYQLYGEQGLRLPDRLHCESIAERSRLHGWDIRPHRHEQLFQCLVIDRGCVQAWLDGRGLVLQGPCVLTVPALAVHGFRFAPDIEGLVVTIQEAHLKALLQPHAAMGAALVRLHGRDLHPAGEGSVRASRVQAAAHALWQEVDSPSPWRAAALDAALLHLMVALARALTALPAQPALPGPSSLLPTLPPSPQPAARPRALAHVQGLQGWVNLLFRRHPTQAELAARLGITPTQLNRACKQVLGHSAQGVLHARLLLQAQRELTYSGLSIKQIAFDLGFSDAAYFTRFFRRGAGVSPAQWRVAQTAGAAG